MLEIRLMAAPKGSRLHELYADLLEQALSTYWPLAEFVASEGGTLPLDLPPDERGFHG